MCDERYTHVYTYCHNMCDYLSVHVTLSLCHTMERDRLDMWWTDCTDILYKISSMILINIYQSPILLCSLTWCDEAIILLYIMKQDKRFCYINGLVTKNVKNLNLLVMVNVLTK